jgi:hypothetical protein
VESWLKIGSSIKANYYVIEISLSHLQRGDKGNSQGLKRMLEL